MSRLAYQYVAVRCVPRVDREEFVNVGVVLFCDASDFLDMAWHCDEHRLSALDPGIDLAAVRSTMSSMERVCRGDDTAGAVARQTQGQRFGFLKAPKSTVLQPGPVHGGLTVDPARQLEHLLERLVG